MNRNNNNKKYWIWLSATIMYMICIYMLSDMPYEQQDLKPFLQENIEINKDELPEVELSYDKQKVNTADPYSFIEFLVRKAGHIGGYFLLTLLFIRTFTYTNLRKITVYLLSAFLSLGYAGADEWHQTFVPGRTGHVVDVVVVDAIGICLAIIMVSLYSLVKKGRIKIGKKV